MISSSGGYIIGRNSAIPGLLIDKTSSQYLYVELKALAFDWTQIWTNLKKIKVTNEVENFQWKCLHNIDYTEHRLKKMNLSNGRCHLCQIRDNDETMQHLFSKCPSVKKIIKEIEAIFNRSVLRANIKIKELNIMLALYGDDDLDVILIP